MNEAVVNIKAIKHDKLKCIDLSYLIRCTKSNSELIKEMIQLYLEQTPPLVIQEYASTQQHLDELPEFVIQLDKVCSQTCGELKKEYNLIRKTKR